MGLDLGFGGFGEFSGVCWWVLGGFAFCGLLWVIFALGCLVGFRFWVLDSDVSADVVVRGGCAVDLVPGCLAACGFGLGWGVGLGLSVFVLRV